MPKQGPKKFTRRDEKDQDRKAAKARQQSAEAKAKNMESALKQYNEIHNPNIPFSKGERRALKAALAAEGISMERWNGGKLDYRVAHIAKERFVNRKYAENNEIENHVEFEVDPWLQMFLHLPVDYREKVEVSVSPVEHIAEQATQTKVTKQYRQKMSRRQAQALQQTINASPEEDEEGGGVVGGDQENSSFGSYDAVEDSEAEKTDPSAELTKSMTMVPTGEIIIRNAENQPLVADPAGRLSFGPTAPEKKEWEKWTLAAGRDGKYTLRSIHGKYLSHCLMWGFVADRAAADSWEEFQFVPGAEGENTFHLFSWRNMYLTCSSSGGIRAVNDVQEDRGFRITAS